MAERRKTKKRREEPSEKILPDEYKVASYLRKKLLKKEAMLFNHKVSYFVASKAIECLMDSPLATKTKSREALFTSRESIGHFLNTMLVHKFFHRARKIVISSKDLKKKKKKEESGDEKDGKKKKSDKDKNEMDKDKSDKDKDKSDDQDAASKSKKDKKNEDEEKKKKRRFKLDMHLDQAFVDGNEIYVWIYDPIPTKAWIIGGLLVIGAVLLCLFPLWPQSCRKGVYYLSIAAAGFLVVILGLAIIRVVVFCLVWAFSFGKRHLWLLPNLTEDVGFLESFWPLFKYEYKEKNKEKEKKKEKSDDKTEELKSEEKKEDTEEDEKIGDDQNDVEEQNDDEFEVLDAVEDELEDSQS